MVGEASTSNENKMSDGWRERASLGVEVWKSSQKWRARRPAVRSIAWLDEDHTCKNKAATNDAIKTGKPMQRASNERSFCASTNEACQTPSASRCDARRYGGMHHTMQFERNKPTGMAAKNGATKKMMRASPVAGECKTVENGTACCGRTRLLTAQTP